MPKLSHPTIWNEILPSLHFQRDWHSKEESACLVEFAEQVPDQGIIVEIGSAEGASTVTLAKSSAAWVHSIDTNHPMNFLTNIKAAEINHRVIMLPGRSKDFAPYFDDESIDLIFIDGDHRYAGVVNDIKSYLSKVKKGGSILFHDYTNDQVRQAVDESVLRNELGKLGQADSLLVTVKN